MSTPLKRALLDHPLPAWKIGMKLDITEARMSKLASGRGRPHPWEMEALGETLGVEPGALFPNGPLKEKVAS